MKKNYLPLILILTLTGCVTTNTTLNEQNNAPLVSAGLINAKMAKRIAPEDANKIQQLIANSPAQANQTWRNPQTHDAYQFISQDISVNAAGQPCRTYSVKTLRGSAQNIQTTACRLDDGSWQALQTTADADTNEVSDTNTNE